MKKSVTYAVIDIETTGGRADRDRITEIAIVLTDGENILDSFESLVNPETAIPYEITRLTGIDNEMVSEAPKFYEIAKKVVEMTEDTIFVAHNVRFDYGFIKEEYHRLGYSYSRKKLCTVVLSRKAFPGLRSYSLGNLISHFGLHAEKRHRAYDDAKVTAGLFSMILKNTGVKSEIQKLIKDSFKESLLPPNFNMEKINNLPEGCGVYYFYDRGGELAYIGKSINIKQRVWEHFSGINQKGANMQNYVADISFEITGSELAAYLLESVEIKKYKPYLNKASKNTRTNTGLYLNTTTKGLPYFSLEKKPDENHPNFLSAFSSHRAAKNVLDTLIREYSLCPDVSEGKFYDRACFDHSIGFCPGICCGKEEIESYSKRVYTAIEKLRNKLDGSWLLTDRGPAHAEKTFFYIEEGIYKGMFIANIEEQLSQAEIIESIKPVRYNPEYQQLIKRFFYKKNIGRIALTVNSVQ